MFSIVFLSALLLTLKTINVSKVSSIIITGTTIIITPRG